MKSLYDDITNPWVFFILVDIVVSKQLKKICKEKDYDFEEITDNIRPLRKSFIARQLEEAAELHKKIDGRSFEEIEPELAKEIKEHVARFAHCGVHHFVGEPYSVEKLFEMKPKGTVEKNEYQFPKEIEWHIKLLSLATFARTHMAETSGFIQYHMRERLLEVNDRLGLGKDDYIWMSVNELIKGLENTEGFIVPDIAARKDKVGVYSEGDKEFIIGGKEVDDVIDYLIDVKIKEFPLRGRVASKGKGVGTAKIVIRPEDIIKVKKGDILVAPETTPDFVIGMKLANAIVTDRGGVTSHAAIVSRELGVPCIVGVAGATSVIKDGDKIEVDAEEGIVRKIE